MKWRRERLHLQWGGPPVRSRPPGRLRWICRVSFAALALSAAAWGNLPRWLQDIPALSRIDGVFFSPLPMPGGTVRARRTPREARAALTKLIAETPAQANLYAWRAHEAEQALDFAAAEADWRKLAELVPDKAAGQLTLADFYHRRLRPLDEIAALDRAAAQPASAADRLVPVEQQQSWRTFERILALIDAHALAPETAIAQYKAWMARYPREAGVYQRYFAFLADKRQYAAAEQAIAQYAKTFPNDDVFPMTARATLLEKRGSVRDAVAMYDQAFRPLWPPALVGQYFRLLANTRNLRSYLQAARAALAKDPSDIGAAARLFYYYQQQGNLAAARRAMTEYRLRKDAAPRAWTADELLIVARLSEAVHDYQEAARTFYALYSLPGATPAMREQAFAGVLHVLLDQPEQGVLVGAGDLSYYKSIATMDPDPGYLNGILSLLLNSESPRHEYARVNQASRAYFHRARASELLARFDGEFPSSKARPPLHMALAQAYATYGDNDAVIRETRSFLAAFPKAAQRTEVGMLMADALARKNNVQEEFAIYDAILEELAARADGVPLGDKMRSGARSPEYARVLDRYIARLVSLKRIPGALALLRGEIDRNPNDPGLYERLAAFLDQNRLDREVEQVYQRAIQQFKTMSWYDRLARWYLKNRRQAEFDQLSRTVIDIFSGTELEEYFQRVVAPVGLGLYRQLNLYAHERFPNNLAFVRNLVNSNLTPDAEREALLRNYWYYDERLRTYFFARLSDRSALEAELQAARGLTANPAATRFVAEAEAWRSHFEEAAPPLNAAAAEFPASPDIAPRAAALDRSLSAFDAKYVAAAVQIEAGLHEFAPRDTGPLTRIGEIYAERGEFGRARPEWNRIAQIEPGKPGGYIEAAAVFWDYFQFPDALRLIEAGRKKLAQPALFAYEAGAIYENRREYARAVGEYAAGAIAIGQSPAEKRLLRLAKRPAQRALVDQVTAARVAVPNPEPAAVDLRIAVLEAQNRRDDLGAFLAAVATRASSLDLLARIQTAAQKQGFAEVERQSLERQIAVTADPVERMRLRLALVRFYEARHDIPSAERVAAAVYADNPAILGIVRATVDFYWRNKMPQRAVDVLARAAGSANPSLAKSFTLEAVRKSTESADYARARKLLELPLASAPVDAELVSLLADTYARQGDDSALRKLYAEKIDALRAAQLAPAERTWRIAALRRALIPVLARQKDDAGAVDQYIEVLRSYPEDEGLAREAAVYAVMHGQKDRLVAYFRKAADDAPRDFRWPLALARIETEVEDYAAAIAAYERAGKVRPDRLDLLTARATLQERLMRLDDAIAVYRRAYELSYRDPQWMLRIAEIRARQGQTDAAVTAIQKALIEGRPERPDLFFDAAARLEAWDLLPQARQYAERGVALAGRDLLSDYPQGAAAYARIMTRLREHEAAWSRLRPLDPEFGRGLGYALRESAQAVHRYFAPEERAAFEAFLGRQWQGMTTAPAREQLMDLARAAGLAGLEAQWRLENVQDARDRARLIELQRTRMRHAELGAQLERALPRFQNADKPAVLWEAARAYRAGEDIKGELRVLAAYHALGYAYGDPELRRYVELLLQHDPERLVALAADPREQIRYAAVNAAVLGGTTDLARRTIASAGGRMPAVWTPAYSGLAALFHRRAGAASDFDAVLGGGTIGERLGKPVDRNARLAGEIWFYYATAYGQYLAQMQTGEPEDYLPAVLEGTPGRTAAYLELANDYRERKDLNRALADYAHALELAPGRGDIHDRMAETLWDLGRRAEAAKEWTAALQAFAGALDRRLAPSFWPDLRETLQHIGAHKLLPSMRAEADRVLRTYVRRNGEYMVEPLLAGAFAAAADPAAGVAWIIDLGRAAQDPVAFLRDVSTAEWLPDAQRGAVYEEIVRRAEAHVAETHGDDRQWAESTLEEARVRWIGYLLAYKDLARAQAAVAELTAVPPLIEVRLAALNNGLDALLARYRREPEKAPDLHALTQAAASLRATGDAASARRVLEFAYTRELDRRSLEPVVFLGLAEVRLEENRGTDAVALLRRLTLIAADPIKEYSSAASLLIRTGHANEAVEFLEARLRAAPWDFENRLELAKALLAPGGDRGAALKLASAVLASPDVAYETRAAAARALRGSVLPAGTPPELALLAAGRAISAPEAEQPFFYHARVAAAEQAKEAALRVRFLSGALAIEPEIDAPRPKLLLAAVEARRYETALAAMERRFGGYYAAEEHAEEAQPAPRVRGVDRDEARALAIAYERTGNLANAASYYQTALALEPPAAVRAELTARRNAVRAEQRRITENERRRPVVKPALEQEHLVEPRLAAEGGRP